MNDQRPFLLKTTELPPLVKPTELKAHLQQYATQDPAKPWLWRVHTDLPAFKKVYGDRYATVIANLIIPKGATIRAGTSAWKYRKNKRKMRASRVKVHSLVTRNTPQPATWACSAHACRFKYEPGAVVRPREPFSKEDVECDSGIHFFLELQKAYYYY